MKKVSENVPADQLLMPCKCGGGMPKPSLFMPSNLTSITLEVTHDWNWQEMSDPPSPKQKVLRKLTCPKCGAGIEAHGDLNMRGVLEITAKWNDAHGIQQNV